MFSEVPSSSTTTTQCCKFSQVKKSVCKKQIRLFFSFELTHNSPIANETETIWLDLWCEWSFSNTTPQMKANFFLHTNVTF
jgi:hypothetical protein